ncbi:MAG: FliH/SctL family protein [Planctomycetota bacterium]
MPVLKQHYNTPALKEAIVLDLGDLGAQANKIRLAAEARATQIINEAQVRANRIAEDKGKEAYEIGMSNGYEAGLKQGIEEGKAQALEETREQLTQLDAAWSDLAGQWERQRVDMEREARQSVLEFALRAAEKLVHRVIEVDDSVIVEQAGQTLSMVLSAHDARLRIHPVDRPMLEAALPDLLDEFQQLQHIDLIDDEHVTPGGCVATFGEGRIDATIERQLGRLIDLILPEADLPTDDAEEVSPDASAIASLPEAAPAPAEPAIQEIGPIPDDATLPEVVDIDPEPEAQDNQPDETPSD